MFSELLLQTVEVYARSGRTDRFGQSVDQNPGQITGSPAATYPCRIHLKAGGLQMVERAIDTFDRVWRMYTETGVVLNEDDAVRVLAQDGTVLVNMARIKDSELVHDGAGPHHREYDVWEQSGPNPARS